jgi:hypothetical protein
MSRVTRGDAVSDYRRLARARARTVYYGSASPRVTLAATSRYCKRLALDLGPTWMRTTR